MLGVLAGVLARVISRSIKWAKHWAAATSAPVRLPLCVGVLAAAAYAAYVLTDLPLGIGPGYLILDWLADPKLAIGVIVAMLAIRFVGVVATTAGGGVGGFFIPLVVLGGLLGRIAGGVVGLGGSALFPILGVAAVLGAGYQVPLAAVMFVARPAGAPATSCRHSSQRSQRTSPWATKASPTTNRTEPAADRPLSEASPESGVSAEGCVQRRCH